LGNAKQHLTALDNTECMPSIAGTVTALQARCPKKCWQQQEMYSSQKHPGQFLDHRATYSVCTSTENFSDYI